MAFTAIAAIASAGAVATGVVAVETLAIAAAVTTVVGTVVKSKELTKIGTGMALGAAGAGLLGLGSEAAAVGAAGATVDAGAEAAGSAGLAGSDLAGAAEGAGAATGSAASAAAGGADAALGAAPLDASLAGAPSTGIIGSAAAPVNAATTAATSAADATAAATGGVGAPVGAVAPAGPMAVTAPLAPWSPAAGGIDGAIKAAAASTNPADFAGMADSSSFFGGGVLDKVGTWVGNNKMLAASMLSLGGGLAQGVSGAYAADRNYATQQDYLKLAQQQAANGSAQPRINMTVNPNANVFGTTSKTYNGIIAGARGG